VARGIAVSQHWVFRLPVPLPLLGTFLARSPHQMWLRSQNFVDSFAANRYRECLLAAMECAGGAGRFGHYGGQAVPPCSERVMK
jgi:hypothetical protein